jgi:hypothetical protein
MPIKISILHPSFNRPAKSAERTREWINLADRPNEIEYLLGIDSIDDSIPQYYIEYNKIAEISKLGRFEVIIGKTKNTVESINNIAKYISATSELIIIVSDDMFCLKSWDGMLFNLLDGIDNFKQPKFILVSEGHYYTPDNLNAPLNEEYGYYIANRAFYNKLGYILWPEYTHYGADTDIFSVAKILNAIVDARHILIKHGYYQQKESEYDSTYARKNVDKEWETSFRVFSERKSRNFDLEA